MLDLMKKTLLTGVGLAVMTKDKVEELAKEVVEKGKLSEKEGKEFVDSVLKRSDEARKDLEGRIQTAVQGAVAKLNVATKTDIDELKAEIEKLQGKSK